MRCGSRGERTDLPLRVMFPGFSEVGLLDDQPSGNPWRMVHRGVTRPSPAGRSWISSRRGGRSSRSHDLQISAQAFYTWRRQQLIDSGQRTRWLSIAAPRAPRRCGAPKRRYAAITVIASEGLPVQVATRVLRVSESGYYEWRGRAPSARAVRHAWLTEQIQSVHLASRGVCGSRRIHAELTLGLGIAVSHGAVQMLMRRAGIKGCPAAGRGLSIRHRPLVTW
jgi:hypothetical protein